MPLSLPPIDIQKKYVDIYLGMQENLDAMTRGAEEMHNTCNAYMERLLHDVPKKAIGTYIELTDERNSDEEYGIDDVRGISIEKKFIDTKANMTGVSLRPYKVVKPNEFCYVTVTSRNGDKISIALNESADTYIVSSSYLSFRIKSDELIPQYLFMFLRTPAFDRFARFNSWGSAREVFGMEDLCRFEIPVPEKEIQQDIVNIFDAYSTRKKLVIELEELQKGICPVLIKGAVEEGGQQ
jgi:type I restriction enzyme S subunit